MVTKYANHGSVPAAPPTISSNSSTTSSGTTTSTRAIGDDHLNNRQPIDSVQNKIYFSDSFRIQRQQVCFCVCPRIMLIVYFVYNSS